MAKTINELKNEQAKIKEEKEKTREELDKARFEKSNTLQEINIIDINLEYAEKELDKNEKELKNNKIKLNNLKKELALANLNKSKHEVAYKKHLRFIYENGKNYYVKMILDANDFHDLLKRKDYINAIIKYDIELFNNYCENQKNISKKIKEITQEEYKIKKLIENQEIYKSNLEKQTKSKLNFINKINNDLNKYEIEIKKLEETSNKVSDLIFEEQDKIKNQIKDKQIVNYFNGGKFAWPIYSFVNISSDYGYRIHPINNKKEFHTGIDIPVPLGTPVHAAESGTIINCCAFGGYGNTIIIRHDDNLCTLYAHNSKLIAKLGQVVKRGDVVALVGSTGVSTAPHCHFEVRLNGSHVDPKKYLALR